jgi:glycosyltransferase involved in cell wall biosynthesis
MRSLCIIPCWNEEDKLSKLINQIKNFDQSKYKVDFLFINNGYKSLQIIKESQVDFFI